MLAKALHADADRTLPATKSLPERSTPTDSLEKHRDAVRALMTTALIPSSNGHSHPVFDKWVRLPPRFEIDPGGISEMVTDAVPTLVLRASWRSACRSVNEALRRLPSESEQSALDRLSDSAILCDGLLRLFRSRVMFMLAVVLGIRPQVFELLRIKDFDPNYLFDGEKGPALGIRGHRGQPDEHRAWKPIRRAAGIITAPPGCVPDSFAPARTQISRRECRRSNRAWPRCPLLLLALAVDHELSSAVLERRDALSRERVHSKAPRSSRPSDLRCQHPAQGSRLPPT